MTALTSGPAQSVSLRANQAGYDYYDVYSQILICRAGREKAYWGYYGYPEDASNVVQDALAPRNFRANLVTLSPRYAFLAKCSIHPDSIKIQQGCHIIFVTPLGDGRHSPELTYE